MKIIHLSDLHLGYKPKRASSSLERLESVTDHLVSLKEPHADYVVVVTGDVADDGSKSANHEKAFKALETLRGKFAVCVAPGNHDYGLRGSFASEKNKRSFKSVFYGREDERFPRLEMLQAGAGSRKRVAFIGLDSMEGERSGLEGLFANGELGVEQRTALKEMLGSPEVSGCAARVVYLHHHPFHPRLGHELKDSRELMELLAAAGNVDALLFGHNHMGFNFNGYARIRRCYDGGSSTRKDGSPSATRVIDLEKDPRTDYAMEIITQLDLERKRKRRKLRS